MAAKIVPRVARVLVHKNGRDIFRESELKRLPDRHHHRTMCDGHRCACSGCVMQNNTEESRIRRLFAECVRNMVTAFAYRAWH